MIDPITGSGIAGALTDINAALQGQTLADAYNQRITGQYPVDDGPTIGFADYTSDTPAISGDTSGSISTGTGTTPLDAWHNYVENNPDVSSTTGGVVSGSKVGTLIYSLMEEHPGTAESAVKAIVPVAVPLKAAITAASQAVGVSIDIANMAMETEQELIDAFVSASGVVYDEAKGLVTAWKDEWGRILFPKKALDAVYDVTKDWGGEEHVDYDDVPRTNLNNPNGVFNIHPFNPSFSYTFGSPSSPRPDSMSFVGEGTGYAYITNRGITTYNVVSDKPFVVKRELFTREWNSQPMTKNGLTYYYVDPTCNTSFANMLTGPNPELSSWSNTPYGGVNWDIAYLLFHGTLVGGDYPEGSSQSVAQSYTPSTIPIAGDLATSYDPDTGDLITEELVPINIPENPYDSTGSTIDPTAPTDDENAGVIYPGLPGYVTDPDDPSAQPQEENVPIPLPIPDTKPSNPDVPLVNPSVIDSTRVKELVEELANTLDPQPGQSSGIIAVPPLPGITDPETGDRTFPSIIPDSGPGFIHVYNPTPSEFVAFGSWLWVTYADATIDKILNNPFDGVIGAHELYATPNRDGRDNIRSAFLVCPTTADLVPNRYSEIDCGTVIVPEFYGNYLDYSPYSQAYIYLPFIGINEVSIDDIVGHAVNIRYRIDAYSGSCIAMIFVAKDGYQNLCYQFAGSCSVEVPMAGGSQAAIKAGMMQAEAYARAAQASAVGHLFGTIGSALMGSLGGVMSGISGIAGDYGNAKAGVEAARVANKSNVQHSGQFGASHGAMGQKVPFIIIRNPIQVKVANYNEDYGFPAHKRVIVGGCTGYLRVREVNVISAHATDDEKAAIEALLKNGVYVS